MEAKKPKNTLQNLFSLKTNCKNRLKSLFYSLRTNNVVSSFLLVLDEKSTKIISSLFKMIELMEFGVTALEKLELPRKKFPKMQAIYMLAPCESSVNLLLKDFPKGSNGQYGLVHLFFTSKVADSLMDKVGSSSELISK